MLMIILKKVWKSIKVLLSGSLTETPFNGDKEGVRNVEKSESNKDKNSD
jgi:hypothetical protein